MLNVKYIDESTSGNTEDQYPFFMNNQYLSLVLYDGGKDWKLYLSDMPATQNTNIVSWSLSVNLPDYVYNEVMKKIAPIAENIIATYGDLENLSEDDELYRQITEIVDNMDSDYDDVTLFEGTVGEVIGYDNCPSYVYAYLRDEKYFEDTQYIIYDSPGDAYDQRMEEFLENVDIDSYDNAAESIWEIYMSYVNDNYESDFWDDFIPQLLNEYDILTTDNHRLYYDDDKEIFLN